MNSDNKRGQTPVLSVALVIKYFGRTRFSSPMVIIEIWSRTMFATVIKIANRLTPCESAIRCIADIMLFDSV